MNDKQPPEISDIREQAGYWIVRQHSGTWSKREALEFQHWLTENPDHRRAFEQVQSLWQGLDQFKNTTPQPADIGYSGHRSSSRQRWIIGGVCASMVLAVLMLLPMGSTLLVSSEQTFTTAKGEQSNVRLADGSEIVLNTDSEVTVQLGPLKRSLTLVRGEASFKVAHERFRDFSVSAGRGRIIDIGTRFNVYLAPEQVVVTVTEGAVKVQTERQGSEPLIAGQRLIYSADGLLAKPDRADLDEVTAWQQGQIVFDMTPLSAATEQMARYHPIKFFFDDPKLKRLKMSGTFNARDLPGFLNTLESIYPLRAQLNDPHTVHLTPAIRR